MNDKEKATLMLKCFHGDCDVEYSLKGAAWELSLNPRWNWADTDYREKAKEKWRDKLFKGAPLTLSNRTEIRYDGYLHNSEGSRLPTLEESPKNVWLCPPDKMPEELLKTDILIRFSGRILIYENKTYTGYRWDEAEAFMIIGDL